MLKKEFEQRVEFEVMAKEYEGIEKEYAKGNLDKDEFCKNWLENGGIKRILQSRIDGNIELPPIKRYKNDELFLLIVNKLKKSGEFEKAEKILDYYLPSEKEPCLPDESTLITNCKFDFHAIADFGSNEGIYLQCFLKGKFDDSGKDYLDMGTFKTLNTDLESMKTMAELGGIMNFYTTEFVNKNIESFVPDTVRISWVKQRAANELKKLNTTGELLYKSKMKSSYYNRIWESSVLSSEEMRADTYIKNLLLELELYETIISHRGSGKIEPQNIENAQIEFNSTYKKISERVKALEYMKQSQTGKLEVGKEYKLRKEEKTIYKVLAIVDKTAFLHRNIEDKSINDPSPFITATNYELDKEGLLSWDFGSYYNYPPIYTNTLDEAAEKREIKHYHASSKINHDCIKAIESALNEINRTVGITSCDFGKIYEIIADKFGIDRVNAVLACHINANENDPRFSPENKKWAKTIKTPHDKYLNFKTHSVVLNALTTSIRKYQSASNTLNKSYTLTL